MAYAGLLPTFFILVTCSKFDWCSAPNITDAERLLHLNTTAQGFCKSRSVWKVIERTRTIRLDCSHSGLTIVPQKMTKALGSLDLSHNNVQHLFKGSFQNYPFLTELIIFQSNVQSIENGTFENLIYLERLILDRNELKTLTAAMFRGLKSLTFVSLSANKITKLPSRLLSDSKSLKTLKLEKNRIQEIEINAFIGLHHLESLFLRDNMLNTVGRIGLQSLALTLLDLGENSIQELEFGALHGVTSTKSLLLDSNNLTQLPRHAWAIMHNLTYLDLRMNDFYRIDMDAFQELKSLERLRLDASNISLIYRGSAYWPQFLKEFSLDDNPLICDCHMRWLKILSLKRLAMLSNKTFCSFQDDRLKRQRFQNFPQKRFLCSCQGCQNEVNACFRVEEKGKSTELCKCKASWEGSTCENVCQLKKTVLTPHRFCHYKAGQCFCLNKTKRSMTCKDDEMEKDIEGEPKCVCRNGLTKKAGKCVVDIDECLLEANDCSSKNAFCINTHGSFRCSCYEGYSFNEAGYCVERFNGRLAIIVGYSAASIAVIIVASCLVYYTLCRSSYREHSTLYVGDDVRAVDGHKKGNKILILFVY